MTAFRSPSGRGGLCVLGACLLAAFASPAPAAIETLQVPETLAATKARLAAGQQANILILGDSLSFEGMGWASWVPTFRDLMRQQYGDAGHGYQSFNHLLGGTVVDGGDIIGSGVNVDLPPWRALDGLWIGLASPGTTANFTAFADHVELHYHVGPDGGIAEVRDGAGTLLTTLNGYAPQPGAAAWTHTFSSGNHTLRIESITSGAFSILGYNNLAPDPGAGGVRVHRASNSGWNTTNYARRDGSFDDQMALLETDLVIIMLGQNEWNGGGPAFESRLSNIVRRAQAVGADVLLLGSYNSSRWYLPSVMDSQQRVAEALDAGFVNLYATAGTRAEWLSNGYLYHDNLHFSPDGAEYMAHFVFDAFVSDGRSVYPWLLGDMNDDGEFGAADIDPWVLAMVNPAAYDAAYDRVWARRSGDFNGDGLINTEDINHLVAHLAAIGSPAVIPEPASVAAWAGAMVLGFPRRQRPAVP